MVHLLKYDTVYGRYEPQVEAVDGKLVIDGTPLVYLSERDPGATSLGRPRGRPGAGVHRPLHRPRGRRETMVQVAVQQLGLDTPARV
jgi:hypothetical protein